MLCQFKAKMVRFAVEHPSMKTSLSLLKNTPLFRSLSGKDLAAVARIARQEEVKAGQVLFPKAAKGDSFHVVVKGSIKIYSLSAMGKTKTFAYLEARDFFGEMALFGAGIRTAAAMAEEASTLLTIRRADFESLIRRRPEISLALLRALCERLARANREIESFSFNSVLGRTAGLLLDLAKTYGKPVAKGVLINKVISHRELADMTGTAREMVSRVISRFMKTGCLESDNGKLIVTDPEKLRGWIL